MVSGVTTAWFSGSGVVEHADRANLDIDITTPAGAMAANISISGSQYERRLISRRTRDALAAKPVRGDRSGARPALLARDLEDPLLPEDVLRGSGPHRIDPLFVSPIGVLTYLLMGSAR